MTSDELKALREEMHLDKRSMALILEVPYRTYQDREYGKRGIPNDFAEKVIEAHRKDRAFMASIADRIDADLAKQYPGGFIPSENNETGGDEDDEEYL